jgi:SOS-response transcriptional repressor LexA
MIGLTLRESQCLAVLINWSGEHGVMPTLSEICEEIGLASKSGPNRILNQLEAKSYIRRVKGSARAIEILDPSAAPCCHCAHTVGSAACRAAAALNITYSNSPASMRTGGESLGGSQPPSPATEGTKSHDWMG